MNHLERSQSTKHSHRRQAQGSFAEAYKPDRQKEHRWSGRSDQAGRKWPSFILRCCPIKVRSLV